MHIVPRQSIEENGRIVIDYDINEIVFLFTLHYNDICILMEILVAQYRRKSKSSR